MADNEGARKAGKFMAICTTPDVCKTPVGITVVPIPYPIISNLSDSMSTSSNVNFGGDPAYIHDRSKISKVTGDEPGTAGGVKSGTNRSIVETISGSSSVNVNRKPVVRHGDPCRMNNGNTMGKVIYQGTGKSASGISADSNPPVKPETPQEEKAREEKKGLWSRMSDGVHTALDVAGFIPGLGAIPDLANAAIYGLEGNAAMAALSVVAAVPGIGDGVKAGTMVVKGGKAIARQAAKKTATKSAKKLTREAAEKAEKELAEKAVTEKTGKEAAKKAAKETTQTAAKKKGKDGAKVKGKKKKQPPRYKRKKKKNEKAEKGEPVYAITGEVIVEQNDFTLPGLIPLTWDRYYGSHNKKTGCCGTGWDCPADARLVAEDNDVAFYDGTSESILFASPLQELPVQETTQGAILDCKGGFYTVTVKSGLTYHFSVDHDLALGIDVERLTDRSGNWIKYERDGNGLSRIHSNTGHVITVVSRGGLIEKMSLQTNGEEERLLVRHEYNGKKELLAVYDALDVPYRFEYGDWGMTRHTNRNGLSFIYKYDEQGRCVYSCGDNNLYKYSFEYLPDRKTRVTDSLGHVCVLSYDENELLLGETDPLGNETRYEYNESFLTSAVIDPLGRRTQYAYNDAGDVTEITRPDGEKTRFFYDALHHLTHVIEPSGNTWRQEWDAQGKLIKQITPGGAETRYIYDTRGVIKAIVDANGFATFCKTDTHGNIIGVTDALGHQTGFEVDDLGNVLSLADPLGNITRYEYDAKSRLIKILRPSGEEVRCGYDAEDNLTAYTNETGKTTRLSYTGTGELAARINPDGSAVYYTYDTEERLTGLSNERRESYSFERDSLGRIIRETDYWGNVTRYTWDDASRLIGQTDALSRTITCAYDPLDRLIETTHASGRKETFAWDASGNLIIHDNGIVKAERSFDADGNVLAETLGAITVENEYDRLGNRIKRTSSHGNVVEYEYDKLGNTIGITVNGKHTAIERNALGLPVKERLPGGHLIREYRYNPEGKLIEQAILPQYLRDRIKRQYDYDAKGNLTRRTTHRQKEIGRQSVTDIIQMAFVYDACDRLIKFTDPEGKIKTYLYDKAGDLEHTREKITGTDNTRREIHKNTEYLYDASGNLIERNGEKGHLQLEWDEAGCLVSSINKDNIKTQYQYDATRRRISKETNKKKTVFGWDGDQLLSYTEDGKVREIVYYPGTYEPFALIENHECVYYYNNDHIGLPQEMINERGQVYWRADYDAQGNVENESGVIGNPLRFQGQFFDKETGLCYNRHRYYDPDRSRFVSPDPLGLAAGENLYAYAPNVWNWVDPLGLCKSKKSNELTTYYPPNDGALGKSTPKTLMPGDKIDRIGKLEGKYFSPAGTPMDMRALPHNASTSQYRSFEVVKPFDVQSSKISPWFGKIGLGEQYKSPVSAEVLLKRGIIK